MRRLAILLAVVLLSAAFLTVRAGSDSSSRASGLRTPLEQPNEWVPFSADVETTTPGAETETGRYFRNSEGSERFEATRPSDGATIIEILNLSESTYYINPRGRGWITRPMDVSVATRRPRKMYAEMPRLVRYAFKLDVGPGGSRKLRASQGFDAYMYTTASGTVRFMVPELNFFPVVMQQPAGHGKTFFNIVIGEPPAELFFPPPGAAITPSSIPFNLKSKPDKGVLASKELQGDRDHPGEAKCSSRPASR